MRHALTCLGIATLLIQRYDCILADVLDMLHYLCEHHTKLLRINKTKHTADGQSVRYPIGQ